MSQGPAGANVTKSTFCVGPAVIELSQLGTNLPLLGRYPPAAAAARPHARIHVALTEGFMEGRTRSLNYPAFNNNLRSPSVVAVERLDAKGQIDLSDPKLVEAQFEGHANPNTLEAMIRIVSAMVLPAQDTLILHASAIAIEGQAHVFAGVSGAGKSTIAQLLGAYGPVEVLSDELLLLTRREGAWFVDVAPFSGKIPLPHGKSAPLKSLNFLEHSPSHERLDLGRHESMQELPRHVVAYVNHPNILATVIDLIGDVVETIPCYRLRFANRADVGQVLNLPCL